jgi:hypothetical protein
MKLDCRQKERELTAVTEQRDKAWQKIENQAERITYLEGAMLCRATGTPLSKAIEQRDRLAELFSSSLLPYMNPLIANDAHNQAQSILQSLTPNKQ